jgi:hypothetical protein
MKNAILARIVSPENRCRFLLGGPSTDHDRLVVDYDEKPVNLADATISTVAKVKRPDGSTFRIEASRWQVKPASVTEAWLVFWPAADEFPKVGVYEFDVTVTVDGVAHPLPPFGVRAVEKHVQPHE